MTIISRIRAKQEFESNIRKEVDREFFENQLKDPGKHQRNFDRAVKERLEERDSNALFFSPLENFPDNIVGKWEKHSDNPKDFGDFTSTTFGVDERVGPLKIRYLALTIRDDGTVNLEYENKIQDS